MSSSGNYHPVTTSTSESTASLSSTIAKSTMTTLKSEATTTSLTSTMARTNTTTNAAKTSTTGTRKTTGIQTTTTPVLTTTTTSVPVTTSESASTISSTTVARTNTTTNAAKTSTTGTRTTTTEAMATTVDTTTTVGGTVTVSTKTTKTGTEDMSSTLDTATGTPQISVSLNMHTTEPMTSTAPNDSKKVGSGFLGGDLLYAVIGSVILCALLFSFFCICFWNRRKSAHPKNDDCVEAQLEAVVGSVSEVPAEVRIEMNWAQTTAKPVVDAATTKKLWSELMADETPAGRRTVGGDSLPGDYTLKDVISDEEMDDELLYFPGDADRAQTHQTPGAPPTRERRADH